jgi:hypothetical protein
MGITVVPKERDGTTDLSRLEIIFLKSSVTGLFQCEICSEYGRETICVNCTYHIRQQHGSIYLREKQRVIG